MPYNSTKMPKYVMHIPTGCCYPLEPDGKTVIICGACLTPEIDGKVFWRYTDKFVEKVPTPSDPYANHRQIGEEENAETGENDDEYESAAEEAHNNLVRSLIEAGGTVREARELLARSLELLYILGYDSGFTNPAIDTLTNDIKQFLEDTK